MEKRLLLLLPLFALLLVMVFSRCRKEELYTDPSAQVRLSADTVLFDTVFTSIGSTTQAIKIYNPYDQTLRVDEIRLRGGQPSSYRISVDGLDGTVFNDIEILPKDSVYIFVEVTIDPDNSLTPFIVEDFIDITTQGNDQVIVLNAFGQNAEYHGGLGAFTLLDCNEVWNNNKPHVIYGVLVVDTLCSLTINEGTQVHVHAKSGILVYYGHLYVNGTLNNEVVFQGDRLEPFYDDIPGQWGIQLDFQVENQFGPEIASVSFGGIWLRWSRGSTIDYAIIKNGGNGIQVDSTATDDFALTIRNTRIENMAGIGLWGRTGSISAQNVLVGNCAESCADLRYGGKYQMDNCTFANYWSNGTRTAPTVYLNNYYEAEGDIIVVRQLTSCLFRNCIMYGNNAMLNDFNELVIDLLEEDSQQYEFKYCLVDTDLDVDDDGNHWANMINQQAPNLCGPADFNFKISNDASRMLGGPFLVGIPDIAGNETGNWKGCYDYTGSCD